MWNNGHDAYLESRILAADPVELVNMLYQGCRQAVRDAREHLAAGRIGERSKAITLAFEILAELAGSLDRPRGGEISERLARLYDYMQCRLLDANIKQSDEPLVEVLGLLNTLSEAWEGVRKPEPKPVMQASSPWSHAPALEPVAAGSAHNWSF
jgi:flagellar protein FliS